MNNNNNNKNHADHGLWSPCSGRSMDNTRLEMENLPKGLNRVNAAGTVHTHAHTHTVALDH